MIIDLQKTECPKNIYIEHIHNNLTNMVNTISEQRSCLKCAPWCIYADVM